MVSLDITQGLLPQMEAQDTSPSHTTLSIQQDTSGTKMNFEILLQWSFEFVVYFFFRSSSYRIPSIVKTQKLMYVRCS